MENELVIIKRIYTALLGLKRNYGLYPANHPVCVNALAQFHQLLDTYLSNNGELRFDITKDSILFNEVVLDGGMKDEGTLPFIFFRDGFRWVEFVDGILPIELEQFFTIINKYFILSNEPDGDIATAFWDTCFEHIRYEVTDTFDDASQGADLASFSQSPAPDNQTFMKEIVPVEESVQNIIIDPTAIIITAEERIKIEEMIHTEEMKAPNDYLDALFDSLLSYRQQENFSIILEVLEYEFKDALTRKDFDSALKILKSLEYIRTIGILDVSWASSLIDGFFFTVSEAQSLVSLQDIWSDIEDAQVEPVKAVLMLMRPEVLHTLGTMLTKPQSFLLRQMLIEVIVYHASHDIGPLEEMINDSDDKLVQMLIQVFSIMEGERPLKLMMNLLRHKSEPVRQKAIRGIMQQGPDRIQNIFCFIDDEDASLRRLILKQIGRSRNSFAENLLLNYLIDRRIKIADKNYVIDCFKALGQCGSALSIEFLRESLLTKGWLPGFWKSSYRTGAAHALKLLNIEDAGQVLDEAAKSIYPNVRRLVRKVKQGQA